MKPFNTIEDVWGFLDSIPMFQKSGTSAANFSLEKIRTFCERLGNPQNEYPSIHVAGTNGKGTTCYLLEKIYADAGYRIGLFTSPHLLRYNERVRVNREEITDAQLLEFFQESAKFLQEIQLSYFEISTALAFCFFAKEEVDLAIIETGLGGRLDSTNIISPEVSVITSIGLDHQNVLGDTIEEIAREKAGIIKKNKPVVLGNITGSPLNEISNVAVNKDAQLYKAERLQPKWKDGVISLNDASVQLKTTFKESINKWNVAMVWKVVDILNAKFKVKEEQLIRSIESFTGAPGRFEKLNPGVEWYFSGSHNAQALESSLSAVEEMKPMQEVVLVFSCMKDKITPEFKEQLQGFKKAYFVEQEGERAAKFGDIREFIEAELITENDKEIILNELKTELVIFMGSFYFYPIVKRWTTNVS
ncbi:bifunctional folylpolyglutamate synthase/dihydrofolate synthase [Gracilimonas sediminicola]|uniref:Dihydrofolate synthase/folylpolyglutamate synthase n=1 Tax=Gracilimonas sediminicola TaxID=2952158 RepID=A0A9X2L5Z4_9BACT|nr:folylpolyglutamate synthase/dihydrofolate synthase family protein [Gracilimonas sediminicola]MCP9292929.1 bifunctional folylpolyglutamate synthase/dihydrofolate synthase [Gracilimonas sediminicola]